ncbi:MAG: hypothetical protein P8R42_06460 [Candidatus Binatia bacterium]|nr:hypothetical protein [Candidatus Binatia bacterium]
MVLFIVWFMAPAAVEHVFGGNFLWLLVGWLFLPLTTLVYAYCFDPITGAVQGASLFAVGLAALFDLGIIGSGARSRR